MAFALSVWCPVACQAFPTWIGVYGSYQRHDGRNPGTYTVLMNQDYPGLRAEVGIRVNAGSWTMYPMDRAGNAEWNSVWSYTPTNIYPAGATVSYFFHGNDQTGQHIWDSRNAQNYSFVAPAFQPLYWVGNTYHWPFNGSLRTDSEVWVNTESWPKGAGAFALLVYSADRTNWFSRPLAHNGTSGNNDCWRANLGHFPATSIVHYALAVGDSLGQLKWDNNSGRNHTFAVFEGIPITWLGDVYHWPLAGNIDSADDLWINAETHPTNAAFRLRVLNSVGGFIWDLDDLKLAGRDGSNDWWHLNLGTLPPGQTLYYRVESIDGLGLRNYEPMAVFRRAAVNGSFADTDADTLPDAWEQYWIKGLSQDGRANPDNDGLPSLALDHRLEYALATEPLVSNDVRRLPVLWQPTVPVQSGLLRLSYEPRIMNLMTNGAVYLRWFANAASNTLLSQPLSNHVETGRLEIRVPMSATATQVVFGFSNALGAVDNNFSLDWRLPVRALRPGEKPDADEDGLPDQWESSYGLDPFSAVGGSGAAGDLDGDGFSNRQEYEAGTDPGNPLSRPGLSISGKLQLITGAGAAHVLALTNASSWSSPLLRIQADSAGAFVLSNVPPGTRIWLRGFQDGNTNGARDLCEASGSSAANPLIAQAHTTNMNFSLLWDRTPPTLTLPAAATVSCGTDLAPARLGWAIAVDANDPAPGVSYADVQHGLCTALVLRTWRATDACGNATQAVQSIHVVSDDTDLDSLPDDWENLIVAARAGDRYRSLYDVDPDGDFDQDGFVNSEEYRFGWNPVDPFSGSTNVVWVSNQAMVGAHTTIQAGIDAVRTGGWVMVRRGLYRGYGNTRLDTRGKALTLRSFDGPGTVIIDCEKQARAFHVHSGEREATTIDGFVIRDGRADDGGGAVLCENSSPVMRRIDFVNCVSVGAGGALRIVGGSPRIERSGFVGNATYTAGGAVYAHSGAHCIINASRFASNLALGPHGVGGALALHSSSGRVERCYFENNQTDGKGAAVYCANGAATLWRTTMMGNRAGQGATVHADQGNVAVDTCISWAAAPAHFSSNGVTVAFSIVQGGWPGLSNRGVDPLLVPGSGRLRAGSPCVDAATPLWVGDYEMEAVWTAATANYAAALLDIGMDEFVDRDRDELADSWERESFPAGNGEPQSDDDADGLSNRQEHDAGTNPTRGDTDGDWIPDGWEASNGMNPLHSADGQSDFDGDGLPGFYEYRLAQTADAPVPAMHHEALTIQQLIDQAPNESVVFLPDGVYTGAGNVNIQWRGKNLMLASTSSAERCIIDCQGAGRGIAFGAGVDQRSVLRGITIRNGRIDSRQSEGGGISCSNASPLIWQCAVVSNRSEIGGGGLYLKDSSAIVRECVIHDNLASYNHGGGFTIVGGSPRVENCTITSNRCPLSYRQGGGGLYLAGAEARIENTVVAGNETEMLGSGLYVGFPGVCQIVNCTIVSNGNAGVHIAGWTHIQNSIVSGNKGGSLFQETPYSYTAVSSLIEGYSNSSHAVFSGNPSLNGHYWQLQQDSPCIDAGTLTGSPQADREGEPRWDHPHHTNQPTWVDIGADEMVDTDLDALPDRWEGALFGSTTTFTAQQDPDGDSCNQLCEYMNALPPNRSDADGDLLMDGVEVRLNLNPWSAFSGGPGVSDGRLDNDGDSFSNLFEQDAGSDPDDPSDTPVQHGSPLARPWADRSVEVMEVP